MHLYLTTTEEPLELGTDLPFNPKGSWYRPTYDYPNFGRLPKSMSWALPTIGDLDGHLLGFCKLPIHLRDHVLKSLSRSRHFKAICIC